MALASSVRIAVLVVALCAAATIAAQSPQGLSGTWRYSAGERPQGFPATLAINVTTNELTIQRNGAPPEVYSLADSETQLPDGRTGKAAIVDGALTLTLVRTRSRGNDGPYFTTAQETYRASANSLTIERQWFGQRPGEPQGRGALVTATYTKN